MSATQTTTVQTTPANPQAAASSGWYNIVAKGIEHGANTVYHRVLNAEAAVTKWEASNPSLTTLIDEGLAFAKGFLVRMGVPVDSVVVIGDDILAALKALAASDPTVNSGS